MATDYGNHIDVIRDKATDALEAQAPPEDDPALCWKIVMEAVEETANDIHATAWEVSAGVREAVDIYCGPQEPTP